MIATLAGKAGKCGVFQKIAGKAGKSIISPQYQLEKLDFIICPENES